MLFIGVKEGTCICSGSAGFKEDVKQKKAREIEPAAAAASQIPRFGGPAEADPLAGGRRDFNPYDSRQPPPRKTAPPAARPAARPSVPAPAREASPGLFSRLFGAKR